MGGIQPGRMEAPYDGVYWRWQPGERRKSKVERLSDATCDMLMEMLTQLDSDKFPALLTCACTV